MMKKAQTRMMRAQRDYGRAALARQVVAASLDIPPWKIEEDPGTEPRVRRGRWLACYLGHVTFGWSMERTGAAFAVNRTTIATACRWAEEARADPDFDRAVACMQHCLHALPEIAPGRFDAFLSGAWA